MQMKTRSKALVAAIAFAMSLMMAFSAFAATTNYTPGKTFDAFNQRYDSTFEGLVDVAFARENINNDLLLSWLDLYDYTIGVVESSLELFEEAESLRDYTETDDELNMTIYTKADSEIYVFGIDAEQYNEDGSDFCVKGIYYRKYDRFQTHIGSAPDAYDSAAIDYVNGEKISYMQLALFDRYDKDEEQNLYDVLRIMLADGKLYMSQTSMTESELRFARVTSVYQNWDTYKFKEGEEFVFDGMNITITDLDGKETVFYPGTVDQDAVEEYANSDSGNIQDGSNQSEDGSDDESQETSADA